MRNPLLVPDLRELIEAGEHSVLRDFFADHHPAQVAEMIEDLEPHEGDTVVGLLPERLQAEVLSYVGSDRQTRIVSRMESAEAAGLLHLMSHDERADLVNRLDEIGPGFADLADVRAAFAVDGVVQPDWSVPLEGVQEVVVMQKVAGG